MKRFATPLLVLFAAACASDDYKIEMPDVTVTSWDEAAGPRITFHLREGEISDKPIEINVDFGETRDFVRSNDLRTCSVLWTNGEGKLHCKFPNGQTAEYDWEEGEPLRDQFIYHFLVAEGVSITSRIARGAPILPRLLITVSLDEENLPAKLVWQGRDRHLTKMSSRLLLELPRDKKTHVLETGDFDVSLTTPTQSLDFLIGLDPDGSPTAASGTVRRAD